MNWAYCILYELNSSAFQKSTNVVVTENSKMEAYFNLALKLSLYSATSFLTLKDICYKIQK